MCHLKPYIKLLCRYTYTRMHVYTHTYARMHVIVMYIVLFVSSNIFLIQSNIGLLFR